MQAMDSSYLSIKGKQLITMYEDMATNGYSRTDGSFVEQAYNDFELRFFREHLRPILAEHKITTLLDYGCGGSDWHSKDFDSESGLSAKEYFNLTEVLRYEPARGIDERAKVECVVNFDVLEHIFIADVPNVIRNIFSYASKLVVINVACYLALAKLPNGENAHITIRQPLWWKGMLDCLTPDYPDISVALMCSTAHLKMEMYPIWNSRNWHKSDKFVIES